MDTLEQQLRKIDVPYPQRRLLAWEVRQDLESEEVADGTAAAGTFSEDVLNELSNIHSTKVHQLLKKLGDHRQVVETFIAFIPLMVGVLFSLKEKVVIDFIRDGGVGMYGILVVGMFLLGREVLNVVRLILIKEHSVKNLQLDTSSVLLGCLALMFMAIGSTSLGLYQSVNSAAAQSPLSIDVLIIGAKESLTAVALSSLLCALVALAHYGTRRVMLIWNAPLA